MVTQRRDQIGRFEEPGGALDGSLSSIGGGELLEAVVAGSVSESYGAGESLRVVEALQ